MSLLKKLGGIGGALTLSTAMVAGTPEKAEAQYPYYYQGPVISRTVIGPFGGVRTRIYAPPAFVQPPMFVPFIRPAPRIFVQSPVFVQPRMFFRPAPVFVQPRMFVQPQMCPRPVYMQPYVQPAPMYVYPPIFCW